MKIPLFDLLKKEHQEIQRMFESMSKGNEKVRVSALHKFQKQFIAHLKAEEASFYPKLEDEPETKMLALEAYEEHHVAEILFNELKTLNINDAEWSAKLTVLKEIVEHHVNEEETEVFKVAEKIFKEDDFSDMYKEFQGKEDIWIKKAI
ncbi:MAG: hemerythrin domain-containing protein [Chitinispirillaceae bacterium]|nr:hemerythrin domain-containing protein [Chitinispirillaceae bacterium]